ncbi:MAG TPA: HAMP domain-containing sensor histidine kinase [Longimicrobiales bacterium]|nr:HAMP domain-containing sensor histidine kinase [Longimicrobiales bacterium]
MQTLLRLDRLERRLFGWLLLLTLVPVFVLLLGGYLVGARSLQWVGTFGPWDSVAESGRALVESAGPLAQENPEFAAALDAHTRELSSSVQLARRWSYLGERLAAALPFLAITLALLLTALALWVGRRLSVQLARPINELAGWADLLASNEPLPPERAGEAREVREVRALRTAMRMAAVRITDARTRELETERVRAWGEMARRVAHEMKNPLTPLRLAAHRLTRHPDADTSLREPIEVIEQETARLDDLARQFAVLGRPSSGPASDVDLRELLERLLESDVPPHVRTRVDAPATLPLIRAHYDALQRAFRNLIRNAVEAIDAAGRSDGGAISVVVRTEPDGVRITLRDTGCGIPPDRIDRLFEPDFTLKAGGTGLGLAVVRQAVAAHGGTVVARSADGGAEFTVSLPFTPLLPPHAAASGPFTAQPEALP